MIGEVLKNECVIARWDEGHGRSRDMPMDINVMRLLIDLFLLESIAAI